MSLKFEIPFNRKIFLEQNELKWELTWKKRISDTKSLLFFAIPLLLVAILFYKVDSLLWAIAFAFGIHYFMSFFYHFRHQRKTKKAYFDLINKLADEFEELDAIQYWGFSEEGFYYKDHRMEMKFTWELFSGFKQVDNHLFIYLRNTNSMDAVVLSLEEIGNEKFKEVISFLEGKHAVFED